MIYLNLQVVYPQQKINSDHFEKWKKNVGKSFKAPAKSQNIHNEIGYEFTVSPSPLLMNFFSKRIKGNVCMKFLNFKSCNFTKMQVLS